MRDVGLVDPVFDDEDGVVERFDHVAARPRPQAAASKQRPSPLGVGIFKRDDWQFYKQRPTHFSEMLQSWDCAFKDTRSSDFVVGQVWGVSGAGRYFLDQVRGQMSFTARLEAICQMSAKWPQTHRKLVEDKANGTAVIDALKSEIPGLVAVQPEGGKEARAHAVSAFVEAHNVYLPADAPWVPAFIEEADAFPSGAHDDQVDALTQALNYIRSSTLRLTLAEVQIADQASRGGAKAQSVPAECPKCFGNLRPKRASYGVAISTTTTSAGLSGAPFPLKNPWASVEDCSTGIRNAGSINTCRGLGVLGAA